MKIIIFLFLISITLIVGCTPSISSINEPSDVVKTYFSAWSQKDYAAMYGLISDGFKSLEPTAFSFDQFKKYAESQGIEEVKIISITQTANDGSQSTVDYDIEFTIKNKNVPFKGTFTLKYKPNDSIPGWKLIHPYGDHIDTS